MTEVKFEIVKETWWFDGKKYPESHNEIMARTRFKVMWSNRWLEHIPGVFNGKYE